MIKAPVNLQELRRRIYVKALLSKLAIREVGSTS